MKKYFLIIILMLSSAFALQAQQKVTKRPINNETYKTWKTLQQYNISNDGKYAWYKYGIASDPRSLVVCTTDGKYKREFSDARSSPVFTANSRHLIFASPNGLCIFEMGKDAVLYIQHAHRYSIPKEGSGQWLSYHSDGDIILKNLGSGQEKKYPKATVSWFNEQGTIWIVQTPKDLLHVSLLSGEEKTILQGASTDNIAFDATGTKIAFMTSSPRGNILRYHQLGMDSASVHVTNDSPGIQKGFIITDEVPQFNQDGQRIFFKLAADIKVSAIQKDSTVITDKVEIWHYKDKYLLSHEQEELLEASSNRTYVAITSVNVGRVMQLESADSTLRWPINNKPDSYILTSNIVNQYESYWNKDHIYNYQLVSLVNGARRSILREQHAFVYCELSLGERFVTWYDRKQKNYFSYETATGITRNITQAVKVPLYVEDQYLPKHGNPYWIAGWLPGDSALVLYDQYDIWQLDPMNKKPPVNITGGYGRKCKITFRLAGDISAVQITTDTLLLTAFNQNNKYNGFWKKPLGSSNAPISCSNMDASLYYFPGIDLNARPPIKAKKASVYLIQRMTASAASNLFATTDFHSFTALSDIHPEREYNWITSELINWKMLDGNMGQAILYKPEDFDPARKYPVIFYYYDKRSHTLFSFPKPGLSMGIINIPWYVSNGYLVCIPDIYYTVGHTGQSAVNSVVSAVKHLSRFSWVDSTKLGLHGHSFGGYETNYLVTRSTLFAAAQPSAGASNMITTYGGTSHGGQSSAFQCEILQSNLGTTPWQRPDIYVENSPVFFLDKVKTPLLIMHNKGDFTVPFAHGLAMFTGLRRLQKPAWLLQYNGEGHGVGDPANQLDFTIRQQQFFDHYLKGKPAPEWMINGISAKYQGFRSGLALSNQ